MDDLTKSGFVEIPFVCCFEEVHYVEHLSSLITRLRAEKAVPSDVSLDLWCDSRDLIDVWFASSHEYWDRDTDFEVRWWQHTGVFCTCFVGWHNVEVFSIPPDRHGEVYVTVPF